MGVLDLLCVTTDSDATTFFGFAYAEDYNTAVVKPQYAVLVKSNTNPSSPGDLNWSVVSMFDGSKLNGYPGSVNGVDTSCTMNALGVFTMFGQYTSTATKVPFGIRYDPTGTMEPRFGYNGRGAWSNITVQDGFNWSGPFNRYALGYTNGGVDAILVHASLSDTNNTITMATLNESTMTLAPKAVWSVNATIHGKSILTLAIGNGHMYTYGPVPNRYLAPTYLTGFPLATISPTIPVGTIYNTTALSEFSSMMTRCYYSPRPIVYVNHGSLTMICGVKYSDGFYPGRLHTIQDPSTSFVMGPAVDFDADVINMDYFVPIGPGSGASTFALIQRYKEMYAFGNDNGFRYTHLIDAVNVTDTVRSNANPPPLPRPSPELSSLSSSALSVGSISGIAVGVIIVMVAVVFLFVKRYRIRKNRNNIIKTTADKDLSVSDEDDDISVSSEKMADESGPTYSYIEGKYPDGSYADGQTGSTEILPMAPITPIPEHMQEELRVLQEKMRVVQEQIRATQFSSHLGPNVVMTVSNTTVSTASGVPGSEPGSGAIATPTTLKGSLESIPHVPPSCLPESMDLDYPNASVTSSVVARPSS
ncbi:MAG: hypothetical protein JOS17DRAFT_817441 [Linnemannia elongata]|nr:MAG: hypothetical protein JOS17DRAFT_817441 [Linnemannia elongata]